MIHNFTITVISYLQRNSFDYCARYKSLILYCVVLCCIVLYCIDFAWFGKLSLKVWGSTAPISPCWFRRYCYAYAGMMYIDKRCPRCSVQYRWLRPCRLPGLLTLSRLLLLLLLLLKMMMMMMLMYDVECWQPSNYTEQRFSDLWLLHARAYICRLKLTASSLASCFWAFCDPAEPGTRWILVRLGPAKNILAPCPLKKTYYTTWRNCRTMS